MSEPYFTRGERVFYADAEGQARFRMTAQFFDGEKDHEALTWDFLLTTRALGGEIPEPAYATEFFKGAIVDKNLAFCALFTTGLYAPGVEFDGAEDALAVWCQEAQGYVLDQVNDELTSECGWLDDEDEDVRSCDFFVKAVTNREDGRDGLLLLQDPPEDELQEVWARLDGKWSVDTLGGSHTIAAHIGVAAESRAWQAALDRIMTWAVEHGHADFVVHAERDEEFLAIEDDMDARKTAEFLLETGEDFNSEN